MLISLAWKNIWRNPKRSLIIIIAIGFGLWGGLLAGALMMGWGESMVNTAIDRDLAHIQLHRPGFTRDRDPAQFIPNGMALVREIRSMPGVQAVSGRTLVDGMAASPAATFGVRIAGIDPSREERVTDIHDLIKTGTYFGGHGRNPIVIGRKLADRLNLKLRAKVVLSFQALDDTLVYAAFRVTGIFRSDSSLFDESRVFVLRSDLLRLLGAPPIVQEIAVRAVSSRRMPAVWAALKAAWPGLSIETWKRLSPEIAATAAAMESWSYIFVGIILMALVFGITNTMLMAVMERTAELGILIAVGMKRGRVFLMILLETLMLSITGGILGMLLASGSIWVLSFTGIDFSAFASSLAAFGASTRLYPYLPAAAYPALVGMIVVAATVAAALPASKAVRLRPAAAIRS